MYLGVHSMHSLKQRLPDKLIDSSVTPLAVYLLYKGVCGICGEKVDLTQASMDHIIPICKNGPHKWGNVQLSHIKCNIEKGKQLLEPIFKPDSRTIRPRELKKFMEEHNLLVKERIAHILSIYPAVSVSMLSVSFSGGLKVAMWREVLEDMIAEGIVKRDFEVHLSPKKQNRTYTKISLRDREVEVK